jgi:hypothetical protein
MKIQCIAMLAVLAGCGAETMGTAATGAQIKKQELQQAQQNLERARERIGQAMELQQQRMNQGIERE